jgi:hypothetical protein
MGIAEPSALKLSISPIHQTSELSFNRVEGGRLFSVNYRSPILDSLTYRTHLHPLSLMAKFGTTTQAQATRRRACDDGRRLSGSLDFCPRLYWIRPNSPPSTVNAIRTKSTSQ